MYNSSFERTFFTQVQITTEECWPGGERSCTCAITVRVGRDVYTVGHCGGNHLLDWVQSEDEVLDVYVEPGYMHKVHYFVIL